jgi:nitrate reductase NapE component
MEFLSNFLWAILSVTALGLWLRGERRDHRKWIMPLLALGMIAVILFPVISVTDDLQIAQNPAEVECTLRSHHKVSDAHLLLPVSAALPSSLFIEPFFCCLGLVPRDLPAQGSDNPVWAVTENRPPPAAV